MAAITRSGQDPFSLLPLDVRKLFYNKLDILSLFYLFKASVICRRDLNAHPEFCTAFRANQALNIRDYLHYYCDPKSPLDWKIEYQRAKLAFRMQTNALQPVTLPIFCSQIYKTVKLVTASRDRFYVLAERSTRNPSQQIFRLDGGQWNPVSPCDEADSKFCWIIKGTDIAVIVTNKSKVEITDLSNGKVLYALDSYFHLEPSSKHLKTYGILLFTSYKDCENGKRLISTFYNLFLMKVSVLDVYAESYISEREKTYFVQEQHIYELDWNTNLVRKLTSTPVTPIDDAFRLLSYNRYYSQRYCDETKRLIFAIKDYEHKTLFEEALEDLVNPTLDENKVTNVHVHHYFQKIIILSNSNIRIFDFDGKLLRTVDFKKGSFFNSNYVEEQYAGFTLRFATSTEEIYTYYYFDLSDINLGGVPDRMHTRHGIIFRIQGCSNGKLGCLTEKSHVAEEVWHRTFPIPQASFQNIVRHFTLINEKLILGLNLPQHNTTEITVHDFSKRTTGL